MFCNKCGTPNEDNATQCAKCAAPLEHPAKTGAVEPARIPNYLAPAIITTICCCVPLGIVAIIFAAQVNSKVASGDIEGAMDYSRKAKMWSWIAFGVGLVFGIFWFGINFLAGVASSGAGR